MMLTASVAALTLAVAATLVAVAQRRVANERARVAVARQLGASALIRQPLDHSLLLAASAVRLDDSPQTRSDLLAALESSPQAERVFNGDGGRKQDATSVELCQCRAWHQTQSCCPWS